MENDSIKRRFIASMTRTGLVYELLDRAVSDLSHAVILLDGGDLNGVHQHLLHAQAIFTQLGDMIQDEDSLSQRAKEVFTRILETLFLANLEKDRTRMVEVREVAERLRTNYYANWEH